MDIKGVESEIRMTVEVKRAATGKVEVYELVGTTVEQDEQIVNDESKEDK